MLIMKKETPHGRNAPAPLSLRLTPEERSQLERDAAGHPLSTYIRSRLFHHTLGVDDLWEVGRLSAQNRQVLLARILAELGHSGFSSSLTEIAEAAHAGVLPLTPDIVETIEGACHQIRDIRRHLIRALGLKAEYAP